MADDGSHSNDSQQGPVAGATAAWALMITLCLANFIDRQVLPAVLPKMKEEIIATGAPHGVLLTWLLHAVGKLLGANPEYALVGLLGTSFLIAYMVATPLVAMIKGPKWKILAGGVLLWSLASGATGMVHDFGTLILVRCLVAVGEATFLPIGGALIAEYYPPHMRSRVFSGLLAAMMVGAAFGFGIGGVCASTVGWRAAFYWSMIPGVVLAFMCLRMKEPISAEPAVAHTAGFMSGEELKALWANKSFVLTTIGMTGCCFAVGGIAYWMPIYIVDVGKQTNLAALNLIFGAILVGSGLGGTLFGGWLADRLQSRFSGSYLTVPGIAALVGLPCWVMMLLSPFPLAWLWMFGCCFAIFMHHGPTETVVANVTTSTNRSKVFALNQVAIHAGGDVISPLAIGLVSSRISMSVAFFCVSLPILLAALVWLVGARFVKGDTEKAQAFEQAVRSSTAGDRPASTTTNDTPAASTVVQVSEGTD